MGYPTIGDKGGKRGFVQTCYIIYLHFLSAVFYGENDEKTTGCRGYPTVFGDSRVDIHKTNTHTHTHQDKVFTNQGKHSPDQKIGVWVRMSAPPKIALNEWFPTLLQKDDQFFDSLVGSKTKHLPC